MADILQMTFSKVFSWQNYCLVLGHETMVCAADLYIFILLYFD